MQVFHICSKELIFDAIVDHLALAHIIRSKTEPATTRIKRLLELISSYSFNLYYMKGNIWFWVISYHGQKNDDSNPQEVIPISFNMYQVLENKFYDDRYLIQMRSQAKSSGIKLPEVHGVRKNLDPNLKPEIQTYFTQTRKHGKAVCRSGKSWIKKKGNLIPSIM